MSLPSCKPFPVINFCPIGPMLCATSPSIQWLANPTTLFLFFIFNISFFASLLYIELLFARLCLIFNISLLASLLYIAHLFARHQVALFCTISNFCCHARSCPRAYFCQHRISIPCVPRSMGRFPMSLCRHKVKHLLFSKPTLDIENLVKNKYRNRLTSS